MAKPMSELQLALSNHRAQLLIIEALSKSVSDPMQQLLAVDLEAFDKRLESWATAAPLHTIISIYDDQGK